MSQANQGLILSFKCGTTIPAQRIVSMVTGTADTVIMPSAKTVCPIGITVDTVQDITQGIPVQVNGIANLSFGDSVASGAFVEASATAGLTGTGVLCVEISAGSYVIGVLVGPSVQVTGSISQVLIMPQFHNLP